MGAIVDPEETLDVTDLASALSKYLPPYALPIFIRMLKDIDKTGTFKLKKLNLQKEGYNPSTIQDKIFFLDSKNKKYIPLNQQLYEDIINSRMGLWIHLRYYNVLW